MSIASQVLDSGSAQSTGSVGADASGVAENSIEVKDPRFDLISKLERKTKQKEQELAQKLKEIEEKEKLFSKYASVQEKVKQNPLEALRELGWEGDVETFNKWALENLNDEELDPVAKRFKQIEETLKKKDQEYEEKLRKAIEEKEAEIRARENEYQIKEFKNSIKSFLDQNKDTYELLYSQPEANELIYEVIYEDVIRQQKAGKEDIIPMDLKDAAERLEKYLDAQLEPLLKSKKIQSKFKSPEDSWMQRVQQSRATINEDMTPLSHPASEELTPSQRMELAIKKLKEGKYPTE
jgi:hypothetical protein